jgi:hypothetical protein
MLETYFNAIEPELVGDLHDMSDWAGKLPGAALRIAGVLHCMDYENLINKVPVSQKTMIDAVTIADYFLAHSKVCYQLMGVDDDLKQVKRVLKKLEQRPQAEYKKNDIYLMCRNSKIKVTNDIEPMLEVLIDYGYLYEVPLEETHRPGRKPATLYKLNPIHFKF